jgi:hypothetical protein
MIIYEISNIEHADVIPIGTAGWRIVMHEGWYIHMQDHEPGIDENGNPTKIYKTATALRADYDFPLVEICAEADLPDDAEICGSRSNVENYREITEEEYNEIMRAEEI